MFELTRFIAGNLEDSITTQVTSVTAIDRIAPLSFVEWVKYSERLFTNIEDFLRRYQTYITAWYAAKNIKQPFAVDYTKYLYTTLINEIVLNYTTVDERRYLKNLDYNNPRDLAIAVPFFAKKIKDICTYFSTLRDDVKTANLRYNLKGSNFGIEKTIYNEISKSLETEDLTDLIRTLNLSLSDIRNNIIVDVEDLYDTYSNYFDINPALSAALYEAPTGDRNAYFSANTYDIDPYLSLNFNTSIINAITSYPFFAIELGDNNFSITVEPNANQLGYLKDSDYINLVNNRSIENLKLNLEKTLTEKYLGTDFYYVSTGSTIYDVISGVLFTAQSNFANYLNKRYPTVAAVPSTDFLKSAKEIGLFFKPDKIGLINFTNFNSVANISASRLTPNTVYIFPDPNKFGNISGNTKTEYTTPLVFTDRSYFNKIDESNSYRFGDADTDPLFQIFRAYQSREQSLNYSNFGLARYEDPQDFFSPEKRELWANKDVYPIIPSNEFPIDQRINTLLSVNKTMVQYKTDVYGNEYGLYKDVTPLKTLVNTPEAIAENRLLYCLILDGNAFYDPVSGYNFDWNEVNPILGYSGVTLKTTNNIPPGTGWWTHASELTAVSPLSTYFYNQGPPEFALSGNPYSIQSYSLQPEIFCPSVINLTFNCNIKDGQTFVSANSGLLPDTSSDVPGFDPNNQALYYTELADGGVSPLSPNFVANFAFAGNFTFVPPPSAVTQFNGSYMAINSASPCGDINTNVVVPYVERSNFANIHIGNRTTRVIDNLSGIATRQTIYDTRNVNYGDFYYRNSNGTVVQPVSSALSAIFVKYPQEVRDDINNRVIDFDVYYDTLQIETENYLIFDQIKFSYISNTVKSSVNNENFIYKGPYRAFEKASTVWFNDQEKELIFCKTTLLQDYSATNYKIIYPRIYVVNLDTFGTAQLYPRATAPVLTFDTLSAFTLSGTGYNINIVEIEKPILNYSNDTGLYNLSYMGKDASGMFYIFNTSFRYFNGRLTNITSNMLKPDLYAYSENFSNPVTGANFATYTLLGSGGSIAAGEFIF
jgi:hypothetical protein